MACLSYFPSKVEYKGEKYGKEFLLNMQEEFVSQLRKILSDSGADPFSD